MLSRTQFEIVQYSEIQTRRDCREVLPNDVAAVYAWFRDLTLSEDVLDSESQFMDAVLALLDKPLSEKRDGRILPFYEVGITITPGRLLRKKREALRQYAKSENTRAEIASALEALTFLQPPLYIGKAKRNRFPERIWEHISGATDLNNQLQKVGLSLQECLLAYVPISSLADGDGETSLAQLMEDIITRLSAPGFVRRIG